MLFNLADPIDAGAGLGSAGNRVYFARTDTNNRIGAAIAVSFFTVGGTGQITDCDIVFNERLYTFSTTTPSNPNQILGSSTYDIGEIATHEMGHCLGLDHSAVAGRFNATSGLEVSGFSSGDFTYQATMYPYGTRTIQGRSLSQDDISGVSSIYPNATLTSTTGSISGRVLNGADFTRIKGAHVVAVSTAEPDIPVAGTLSDVAAGGPGGEFNIVGLPPGDYYLRLEPLVGSSNPFTVANTHFTGFDTNFPPEYYDGSTESGFDDPAARVTLTLAAGHSHLGLVFLTNVGAPDPNEPNNTRASATIAACEQVVTSSLVPTGDVDYFALSITVPTHLDVDVNAARSGSALDPILGIFDAAGNSLAFADNTIGLDPALGIDLYTSGTYYVALASYNDTGFNGTDARTVGSYTLSLHCAAPLIATGTCPGRVLYAASNQSQTIVALSDVDRDLVFDGQTVFKQGTGNQQGSLATRRDGGVCAGSASGTLTARWDDTEDFTSDRETSEASSLVDAAPAVSFRRSGAEYLYTADLNGGGTVVEMLDTNGDFTPERAGTFTAAPGSVLSATMDEAGTLYVLDVSINDGLGGIRAFRDLDGDGAADVETLFLDYAPSYAILAARRPGEVYATDIFQGQIDRIVDTNGDGIADQTTPYATGLALDLGYGIAFDDQDVLYVVDGGTRVLALPDDDGDGAADRQVQFSPLLTGLGGITMVPGPPETVSPPGSYRPLTIAPSGPGLRITWEDQGPTVPAYNIYEGALGSFTSHAPRFCHVLGTSDGLGSRFLDIVPTGSGNHYYLVTASDACGEGSAGRSSDGRRRPLSASCGAAPP